MNPYANQRATLSCEQHRVSPSNDSTSSSLLLYSDDSEEGQTRSKHRTLSEGAEEPDQAGALDVECHHQLQQSSANQALANQTLGSKGATDHMLAESELVKKVNLFGECIVALTINAKERLCLAQISNTLLKDFSYNEIHNRRVALGITCLQCTPVQLEMLRRAGAMPSSSRRCGMITMREAERLCRSFLVEEQPPELPDNFHFTVAHRVNYGCRGRFVPARYISSRAKCIECFFCGEFYSPNKFIFHSHRQPQNSHCNPPDSPNINSWRKHIDLDSSLEHSQEIKYAWEDVKSLFNGGTRRRAPGGPQAPGSLLAIERKVHTNHQNQQLEKPTNSASSHQSQTNPEQFIDVEESTSSSQEAGQPIKQETSIPSQPVSLANLSQWQANHFAPEHPIEPLFRAASAQPTKRTLPCQSGSGSRAKRMHMGEGQVSKLNSPIVAQASQNAIFAALSANNRPIQPASTHPFETHLTNAIGARTSTNPSGSPSQPIITNTNRLFGATDEARTHNKPPPISLLYPNLLYNHLYMQLVQPQLQQQPPQSSLVPHAPIHRIHESAPAESAPISQGNQSGAASQLSLRHQIWASLLANFQANQHHNFSIPHASNQLNFSNSRAPNSIQEPQLQPQNGHLLASSQIYQQQQHHQQQHQPDKMDLHLSQMPANPYKSGSDDQFEPSCGGATGPLD